MSEEQDYIKELKKDWQEMNGTVGINNQWEKVLSLCDKLMNFIKVVLKDELRMKEISLLQNFPVYIVPKDKAPNEGRIKLAKDSLEKYKARLYVFLASIEDELKITEKFGKKVERVDKLDEKIKKAKKESERRSHVVDSKVLGAIMELLDIQRDELKKRDAINKKLDIILKKIDGEKVD